MGKWLQRKIGRVYRSQKLHRAFMRLCGLLPLQRKIVFSSYCGRYFSDNPLEIFNEVRRRDLKIRCVWLSSREGGGPEGAKTVQYSSYRACYHLATARVWVDNQRKQCWIYKRKHQFYVQTWHAGLSNKSGEADEEQKLNPDYVKAAKHDSEMADLFISGSAWQTAHYRRAFWYDGEILESGLPRSDIFFRPSDPICEKVRRRFDVGRETKLALYAPTFRNKYNGKRVYDLDCRAALDELAGRFGGEWVMLVRMHPNVRELHEDFQYDDRVLDASLYPNINELIVASEWLITDYSSCAFDAMEAGKCAAIYAPDLEEYRKERGFYWEFEALPFPLARTNVELQRAIRNFDLETYRREAAKFLESCGVFDDGKAAERVVDRMLEMMGKAAS